MKKLIFILFLPISLTVYAQEVKPIQDKVSWFTVGVVPTIAVVKALKSNDKWCKLGQLGISELVGNTTVLTMKHFIISPRPCIGCDVRGMPSGHSMNSMIGISSWYVGGIASWGTGELRYAANKHTVPQILVGWTIGGLSELAGQKLLRCKS